MIRQKLDIHKFKRSGEVPPTDHEDWIMWQFQNMLLNETEAIKAIAEYRRLEASMRKVAEPARQLKQAIADESKKKSIEAAKKQQSLAEYKAKQAAADAE